MKIINNNFDNIENFENFDFESFIKKITKYISSFGLEEDRVSQIYIDLLNTVIEYSGGVEYAIKYNGAVNKRKYPSYASAFHTLVELIKTDDGINVSSGIVIRNNIKTNLHIFVHEFFHASSEKRILMYDNNLFYTKAGFSLNYWNKEEKVINGEYDFGALNEGITEILTQGFLNEKGQNNYLFQVVLAKMLCKYDSSIIEAYFSREDTEILAFANKFNELQDTMQSSEFAKLPIFIIYDEDLIYKALKSCIEYSFNCCKEMNIPFEKEWIIELVSQLDESLDYKLDNNSYVEMANAIIEQIMVNNRTK